MDDGVVDKEGGRPRARSLVGTLLLRSRDPRRQSVSGTDQPPPLSDWALLGRDRAALRQSIDTLARAGVSEAVKLGKALTAIEALGQNDPAKAAGMFKSLQHTVSALEGNPSREALFPQTRETAELMAGAHRETQAEARNAYVPRWDRLQPQRKAVEDAIKLKSFGDPPPQALAQALQQFTTAANDAGGAAFKLDYVKALRHVDAMEAALQLIGPIPGAPAAHVNNEALEAARKRRPEVEERIQRVKDAIAAGRYAGVDPQALAAFAQASRQAALDLAGAGLAMDGAGMNGALDALL
ncbi:flagellar biosynthesis anti-sigma factor FlgM, partial [Pelomonas sp. KK5]|uniref:flagellar biosynthesis anti-sigma factor FlgM n=1 Tax=Pelomonas sp. KK5 TaxID=1855730 RepID=UPI0011802C88